MQNSMVIFTFLFPTGIRLFEQIWSKKSKLSVKSEISDLDEFEYAEFNGGVHFFYFRPEAIFAGKFGPNNQNFQFQLKFGT